MLLLVERKLDYSKENFDKKLRIENENSQNFIFHMKNTHGPFFVDETANLLLIPVVFQMQ